MLMSLFDALRASRASILEKPISTNRATCRIKITLSKLPKINLPAWLAQRVARMSQRSSELAHTRLAFKI